MVDILKPCDHKFTFSNPEVPNLNNWRENLAVETMGIVVGDDEQTTAYCNAVHRGRLIFQCTHQVLKAHGINLPDLDTPCIAQSLQSPNPQS